MARRPRTPAPGRAIRQQQAARSAPRLTPARALGLALSLTAALTSAACSITINPGPGEETAGGVARAQAGGVAEAQLGEAAEPIVVAEGARARGAGTGPGTIAVKPAPRPSPGTDDDAGTPPESAAGDSGDVPVDTDPAGGAGGAGEDDAGAGQATDLSDPVQYAGALEAEVNLRREQHGLPALTHDECAYEVALERAEALRGQELAHAPLEPIFDRCPTSTVGENLARGGWTPAEAAGGWMNSEGHRANILNASFTRGAVACISEETGYGPQMTCAHVFLG
ncbi:CAP domain-containing protein [Myceligenerans crystallogenes]|uniref:SCP domain-containing protein n=1 Tax=Myceligenerans crystallogenes TaxID=316335 RepID=A0ABP4ZJ84_9MICO